MKKNIELVKKEIHDVAKDIDPNDEHCWYSIVLGWALGKGATPKQAEEFSLHVRYKTPYC